MYGFRDLSTQSLESVITKYKEGLDSGLNYPCGVNRRRVEKWLLSAENELNERIEE
jgi:hypothetical protein